MGSALALEANMGRGWPRALLVLAAMLVALALGLLDLFGELPVALATACPGPDTAGYICPDVGRAFVAGTTLVPGSQCDDCVSPVALPFPFTFYGTVYNTANVSSNGNLQFASSATSFANVALPSAAFNDALFPFWDDQVTTGTGQGVFTRIQGSAPNRVFVVEWRTANFSDGGAADYEILLEETTNDFYFVYGASSGVGANGASATSGIQRGTGSVSFLQRSLNTATLTAGSAVRFTRPVADLSVVMTGPSSAVAGTNITYTITVTNNGPDAVQDAVLTGTVPPNTTFVSFTAHSDWSTSTPPVGGTGLIRGSRFSLEVATPQSFTLVLHVSSGTANGTLIGNTAQISGLVGDSSPANNTSTVTTTLNTQADVSIFMTAPATVVAGNILTYTFAFANNGPSDAVNVTATDQLPSNVTFVSASPSQGTISLNGTGLLTFTLGTIGAGSSATASVVVSVAGTVANNTTLSNTVTTTSSTTDVFPGNNTSTVNTTVINRADLSVTMTDTPDPVQAGNNLTYTFAFANGGPRDAVSVTATDQLPSNVTFVSASPSQGTISLNGTGLLTFTLGTIGAGGSATATVVVSVNPSATPGSTITNTATVASSIADPNNANNTASASTTVLGADLSVTQTASPNPVLQGQNVSYTITVSNPGPNDAQSFQLVDNVPANTTFVSETHPTGFACTAPAVGGTGPITCTRATFVAGVSATFTFVMKLNASTPADTVIANTATVSSATPDPSAANNTAIATVSAARQNVGVQVTPSAGRLQSTITARNAGCGPNDNRLLSLHYTRTDNATVDVLGQVGRSGDFTVPVSPPAQQVNFFINRLTAGQAATVRLIVTDGCGTWETLAGGGNNAFPPADAPPAPAPAAASGGAAAPPR